jgi:alpha-1,2-mannosyltransferase
MRRSSSRPDLIGAAIFCAVVGLYDIAYVASSMVGGPVIGPVNSVRFPDFLVFYAAAHAYFEGKLALVYDVDAFTGYQNALFFPDYFPRPVKFRPFLYPPTWLLMLLPFGLPGVAKAFGAFLGITAMAATAFEGRRNWWGWLAVLVSPAAVWVVIAGQNTFLSVALLYGGFRLLDRVPASAGILLGLLSYKPQIWVLVPLALLAARQWRAMGWMIGTVVVLSLASLVTFGAGSWLAFLDAAQHAASPQAANEMFERIFPQMTTLLAAARIVSLPPQLESALQLASALLAIAVVWHAFRHYGSSVPRTAVMVTATFLISPYTLNYDMLLLMPAVVLLFQQAVAQKFLPLERMIYLLLWLAPTVGWILNQLGVPIIPLVILAFGVVAWLRLTAAPTSA